MASCVLLKLQKYRHFHYLKLQQNEMASSSWAQTASSCPSSATDGLCDQGQLTSLLAPPPSPCLPCADSNLSKLIVVLKVWSQVTGAELNSCHLQKRCKCFQHHPSCLPPQHQPRGVQLKTNPTKTSQTSSPGELGPREGWWGGWELCFLHTAQGTNM